MPTSTEIILALIAITKTNTEPGNGQTREIITAGDLTISAYREDNLTLSLQAIIDDRVYISLPILHWHIWTR